jgi:hypothetical protein
VQFRFIYINPELLGKFCVVRLSMYREWELPPTAGTPFYRFIL